MHCYSKTGAAANLGSGSTLVAHSSSSFLSLGHPCSAVQCKKVHQELVKKATASVLEIHVHVASMINIIVKGWVSHDALLHTVKRTTGTIKF